MLRCDRCGLEKEDVRVFASGDRLRTSEAEYRLREFLQGHGKKITGSPRLCEDCEAILRSDGRGLLD